MGFLDKFKGRGEELKTRAAGLVEQHGDKIDKGLDKASDAARKATKGKYDAKIDTATSKAKDSLNKLGDDKK